MLPTVMYPMSGTLMTKVMTTNANWSLHSDEGYFAPQPTDFEGHLKLPVWDFLGSPGGSADQTST